jgi:hypothetical protein
MSSNVSSNFSCRKRGRHMTKASQHICMQLLCWDARSQHTCTRARTRMLPLKVNSLDVKDVRSSLAPVEPQGIARLCQSTHRPAGTAKVVASMRT